MSDIYRLLKRFSALLLLQTIHFIAHFLRQFWPKTCVFVSMIRIIYRLMAATIVLLISVNGSALPRSVESLTSTPKKNFDVKMKLNKVDLGESIDVELTHTPEECKNYRTILANMHNAKEKKLDETFFQSIGKSLSKAVYKSNRKAP